ncbi:MAG: FtsQ-type POTRA domain-containing protein [Candidatus Azambacteria bacterium]|nr:FtsQ-type POTRA domain-containing protein [Candidatus Azambacteria bacterium]
MPSSRYYRFKAHSSKERAEKIKTFLFWSVSVAIFIFIMWSFFASPFFKITKIKLPENDIVTTNDIRKIMSDSAPFDLGENLFILSKNNIKGTLTAAFPTITSINVEKELFNGLTVRYEKRIPVGIWCGKDNCYYFDKEGIIFKEAPVTEGGLILKIQDSGNKELSLGAQAIKAAQLKFIMDFNNKLSANGQIKIIEFKIGPSADFDLTAVTANDWLIYLNQKQNPALAASNLFTVLNEVIKNKVSNLEYIDLRIPTRIFYKLK